MSKLLQTVGHPISQDFSGKLSGVFGASARVPLFPVLTYLFMEKQSVPKWLLPDESVGDHVDLPEYHAEMRCLGEDHQKSLAIDLMNEEFPRPSVRLGIWDGDDDHPSEFSDFSPERARELAKYLQEAATVAENFAKTCKVITRGRLRVTILTEKEVSYPTPCDGQVRRLFFEGKECGKWSELATFEESDLKDIRILMKDALKAIAEMDPLE